MSESQPTQKEAIEQLSNDIETCLNRLDVYFGKEVVDVLHNYVTSQIALLLLDFEALKHEVASERHQAQS